MGFLFVSSACVSQSDTQKILSNWEVLKPKKKSSQRQGDGQKDKMTKCHPCKASLGLHPAGFSLPLQQENEFLFCLE